MMYGYDGVGSGWFVVMVLVMVLGAALVAGAIYLGIREVGRERHDHLPPRG